MSYSFLDLAIDVLKKAPKPLSYQEMWHMGEELGLAAKINSKGKTPWQTLGAQLYVDVRDNGASKFIKVGKRPARFFLADRRSELTEELVETIDEPVTKEAKPKFKERDLHPVLAYFAYANPAFNRGREIITKTIFHEKSQEVGLQ